LLNYSNLLKVHFIPDTSMQCRTGVADGILRSREYGISRLFATVTLTPSDPHIQTYDSCIPWIYPQTKNELSTSTLSKVIVLQTDRHTQTDATENITTPLRGW